VRLAPADPAAYRCPRMRSSFRVGRSRRGDVARLFAYGAALVFASCSAKVDERLILAGDANGTGSEDGAAASTANAGSGSDTGAPPASRSGSGFGTSDGGADADETGDESLGGPSSGGADSDAAVDLGATEPLSPQCVGKSCGNQCSNGEFPAFCDRHGACVVLLPSTTPSYGSAQSKSPTVPALIVSGTASRVDYGRSQRMSIRHMTTPP